MEKKNKPSPNRVLFPVIKKLSDGIVSKRKTIVAIATMGHEEKNDCPFCSFHPYYGVELIFVLHYSDRTIQSICYKCGKKLAKELGVKLPRTLAEIEYIEGAADRKILQKVSNQMEMERNGRNI